MPAGRQYQPDVAARTRHSTPGGYSAAEGMLTESTYSVPGMHCGHCERAVSAELEQVAGVESLDVDLETKLVSVRGSNLDDALLAAIEDAGYEAA